MSKQRVHQTMRALLDASHNILAENGPGKLTFDTVVERANLSKGALLHHFKSKNDLLRGLLQDAIDDCNKLLGELRGDHRSAGSFTRAYIKAFVEQKQPARSKRIFAILSFLAYDDDLKAMYAEAVHNWSMQIERDGLDPVIAEVVRLATDGLWWNEAAESAPLNSRMRNRFASMLFELASPPKTAKRRSTKVI